jgi:hypothetical protein
MPNWKPGRKKCKPGLKKTALGEALAHDLAAEIERLVGREAAAALDFEALEMVVRRHALRFAARVVEQRLNVDHSDFTGARRPCPCGQPARYVDRRTKPFQSVLGELRLERAYYYCAACQRGFCPRDQQLGMEDTSLSPAVTRMVGTVGALAHSNPTAFSLGAIHRRQQLSFATGVLRVSDGNIHSSGSGSAERVLQFAIADSRPSESATVRVERSVFGESILPL